MTSAANEIPTASGVSVEVCSVSVVAMHTHGTCRLRARLCCPNLARRNCDVLRLLVDFLTDDSTSDISQLVDHPVLGEVQQLVLWMVRMAHLVGPQQRRREPVLR